MLKIFIEKSNNSPPKWHLNTQSGFSQYYSYLNFSAKFA